MPCVLVTGARGNVGAEVVAACLAQGLQVRAGVRATTEPREPDKAGRVADPVAFDFLDRTTWPNALRGCRYVFLLRPPALSDMSTTLNPFIDRAQAEGVEHIVFLSVSGAEDREWVPHRKVERHLEASGRNWTVLRPGFFAQNLQDAYRRDICEDQRLYVPAGSGRVAFIDVKDAAEIAALIFTRPEPELQTFRGQALTLTGPRAITFAELAEILSRALARKIRYEPASLGGYAWHLHRARGLPWLQVAIQTYLHWGLRRGDASTVDPTVQRILGRPASSIEDYVSRSLVQLRAG